MREAAQHFDSVDRGEASLRHVPTPRGSLYAWIGLPRDAKSCVVVCSSVLGDFTANYHRERLLGLTMLDEGHAVIRFHYTGEGNSEGERRDMTFSTLCEDTRLVIEHVRALGISRLALLGTRLGSLVAAAAVSSNASIPLALWEPVAEPLQFINEAHRARRMSRLSQNETGQGMDWRQELDQQHVLDFLGYDVYKPLIESFSDINFLSAIGDKPRPIFLARFSGSTNGEDPLVAALLKRGFPVDARSFDLSEAWWFHNERVPGGGDLVSSTADWINGAVEATS